MVESKEIFPLHIPQSLTPFQLILDNIKDEFVDQDFPPTYASIWDDELNMAYSEYHWVTSKEAETKGCYIMPKSNDIDLLFQENTSLHIIVFLKLLSKDYEFLKSIISIPKEDKNKFPKAITIKVYRNDFQEEIVLDTNYVVDEVDDPIFANEADQLCLWPSFIIKALAKWLGSYYALEDVTLEDIMSIIYGPSIISSRHNTGRIEAGTQLDKWIRKDIKDTIVDMYNCGHCVIVKHNVEGQMNDPISIVASCNDKQCQIIDIMSEEVSSLSWRELKDSITQYFCIFQQEDVKTYK